MAKSSKSKTKIEKESNESKEVKKKEFKLDIFKTLAQADKCNLNFYNTLDDEQKKAFAPLIIMRWMSAVNNGELSEHYITTVNELVNIGFWDLTKHPELQWKLLASSGVGFTQRHEWIPLTKKNSMTTNLDKLILSLHPSLNDTELDLVKAKLTKESLNQLCRDFAMEDNEIKPIIAEYVKYKAE